MAVPVIASQYVAQQSTVRKTKWHDVHETSPLLTRRCHYGFKIVVVHLVSGSSRLLKIPSYLQSQREPSLPVEDALRLLKDIEGPKEDKFMLTG